MTASAPTGALAQKLTVWLESDKGLARGTLHLSMTFQAKIRITLDQQLPTHRTVRVVTDSAAFPQGLMLKNEWPGLFTMTLSATLVKAGHRQTATRFENVTPVRVVTLHAIHPPLDDRVMLRQIEFSMRLQMTLKTGRRIFSGINNKSVPAPGLNVFAAWTMA